MNWKMYLDDLRTPTNGDWTIVRSSADAMAEVTKRGRMPVHMSLDHDLGGDDNTMVFLKELFRYWEEAGADPKSIPTYVVHSANPVGVGNIISYMDTWRRAAELGLFAA